MKVALVVMPWFGVEFSPLGVAALKSHLGAHGIKVDCLYLNLRMFARIGAVANELSNQDFWAEWFFAYHLYGPGGSGELGEGLKEMQRHASFRTLLRNLNFSRPRAERFLKQEIPAFLQECLDEIRWSQYDLIGFTSTFWTQTASLALSRELKRRYPKTPIAMGGANVEGEMGVATLKGTPWLDYVFDGEAEESLLTLLQNLQSGRPYEKIPYLSFRRGTEVVARETSQPRRLVDLSKLPDPDHDDFFAQLESTGLATRIEAILTFEASRGCWWGQKQHCTFCGLNDETIGFRHRDADAVLKTILSLQRRHRVNRLLATDNILGVNHLQKLVPQLARARKEQAADWEIFFEIKANLSKAQLEGLVEAGICRLQPGIESLSTPILKLMHKGIRAIQNIQTIKLTTALGISVAWNLLWGFPGEPLDEYERTKDVFLSLTHLQPPSGMTPIRIDRFSPSYCDWKSLGYQGKPTPQVLYQFLYPSDRYCLEEIASYFDPVDSPPEPPAIPELTEIVDYWRNIWGNALFTYRQGVEYVEVFDCRPRAVWGGLEYRVERVEGLEATVFASCDTIRSFAEIVATCRGPHADAEEGAIRQALERLTARRWLYQENNQYLNLAVPVSKLTARQKIAHGLLEDAKKLMWVPVHGK